MTGQVADYFVAAVSVILGAVMIFLSACSWDRVATLGKPRWFEERMGRTGARLFFSALGAALIALGIAIASGFSPAAGDEAAAWRASSLTSLFEGQTATTRSIPKR